tara:strand:- start:98 stop:505 length:408 start_codon:yes stop_codon:yes gene_type:complete
MKVNTLFGSEESETFKCIYCGEQKPVSEREPKGSSASKNRCRPCRRKKGMIVDKLKKEYSQLKPSIADSCVICERTGYELIETGAWNGKRGPWTLDHDHKTEMFRGWICQHCNNGLGGFRDSIRALERAIEYLKK